MTIEITFSALFAGINSVDALKETAQSLIAQIHADYTARAAELATANLAVTAKVAEPTTVEPETAPTPKVLAQPEPKAAKKATPKAKAAKAAEPKKATAKKAEAAPKTEAKPKVEDVATVAITDAKTLANLNFTFEKYSEKCWVLRGDTKAIRKDLKEKFNGKFNSRLKVGGEGWIIMNKNCEALAKALNLEYSAN